MKTSSRQCRQHALIHESTLQGLFRNVVSSGYLPAVPALIDSLIEHGHDAIAVAILRRWKMYRHKLKVAADHIAAMSMQWTDWAITRETESFLEYVRKLVIPIVGEAWSVLSDIEETLRYLYARSFP